MHNLNPSSFIQNLTHHSSDKVNSKMHTRCGIENGCLLGSCTVKCSINLLTLQNCLLPPSSGSLGFFGGSVTPSSELRARWICWSLLELSPLPFHQTNYYPCWCTVPDAFVTRKSYMVNWSLSRPLSGRMATATGRICQSPSNPLRS